MSSINAFGQNLMNMLRIHIAAVSEQISIAWSGFDSAINGFVTLLAAIIGIGGIIGGWFLRKFKSRSKDNSFDEYRKKYNEGW